MERNTTKQDENYKLSLREKHRANKIRNRALVHEMMTGNLPKKETLLQKISHSKAPKRIHEQTKPSQSNLAEECSRRDIFVFFGMIGCSLLTASIGRSPASQEFIKKSLDKTRSINIKRLFEQYRDGTIYPTPRIR